ncbi:hypothetical protein F4818DRAFT_444507 [Hypoxylon cercidicola]|nr:hypothetical protein F4818DRAFT_444507 [Hypoxylon cercidicola]
MLFSKLCLATAFLAGALAAPLPSEEGTVSRTYSLAAYSIIKDDGKRSAAAAAKRNGTVADGAGHYRLKSHVAKRDEPDAGDAGYALPEYRFYRREATPADDDDDATTTAAVVVDSREADGVVYHSTRYLLGGDEKRGVLPDEVYARVAEDIAARGEGGGGGIQRH